MAPGGGYRLWPAPSRFSPDQAVGLCVAGAAEPARHVRDRRRPAVRGAAIQQRHPGRAGQYPRAAGSRHGPCPSERPLCLCRQSRFEHGRGGDRTRLCRRRKHPRGLCDRPRDRRAQPDPACRYPRHPLPHLPHRPERPNPCRSAHHGAAGQGRRQRSARCRPASRYSASAPTASSISCANTMSMSATGRCSGWGWCKPP